MVQLKCDPEWPVDAPETSALVAYCGLRQARYDLRYRQTWLVDLEGGIDAVRARVPDKVMRKVRTSAHKGVVVTREQGPEAVSTFYTLHMDTISRKKFNAQPLSYFQAAAEELGASIFIASLDGTPLAADFAIAYGRRLLDLYRGTSTAMPSAQASYAVQWEMIKWGVESGCTAYDMCGMPQGFDSANPSHRYAVFKTRWGGHLESYPGLLIAPVMGPLDPVVHGLEAALLRSGIVRLSPEIHVPRSGL
jgi:lipid II:glycine glycyltransferase (peptidoglycan interpeptide bridge formation enzyme)